MPADSFELAVESNDEAATVGALRSANVVVVLDTTVTAELASEGLARDVVRVLQEARRDAGLVVTDRITTQLHTDSSELAEAVETWRDYIAEQILATSLELAPAAPVDAHSASVDNHRFNYTITHA